MKSAIPILTPLRGIAALCVVFFHARIIIFPQWMTPLTEYTHFVENGYLWVDLFFILSGFVMMHVYQSTFVRGVTPSKWKHFIWLRFSRIYPLFFITLIVLITWETFKASNGIGFYGGALFEKWGMSGIPAFEGPFNRSEALLPNALMLHGFLVTDLSWNISSWSLSVEWLSYMIFPFLVSLLLKRKLSFLFPVIFILGLLYINHTKGSLDVTGGLLAFIRAITSFTLGAWMYTVSITEKQQRIMNNDFALWTIFAICIGLLHLQKTSYHNVLVVSSFAALVLISAQQSERNTPVFKLLDNRFTRFLGDISYSLYLWHAVLLLAGIEIAHLLFPEQLTTWQNQTSWGTACIGAGVFISIAISISTLSYYYLEKPAIKILRARRQRNIKANSI
ncbi:acyltransferase [Photobacterium sp. ZSDE20]|uniref:Acyltransferase n=1 Tax=Photobacterium pectinilyticum TaxID=2906793 RepID=A0ABT1N4A7_9GAMM|nr:acyltransferase [Photobacterium sp. ZSDE20]MCQ1059580.1 acyltransferase [Photobacterium sp. ZSDE20]MDD1825443.1 acyltransferase [Photobacterium sp. ZSDE20]